MVQTTALVKYHASNFVKPNLTEYWKYSVPIPLFNKHQETHTGFKNHS